MSANNTKAKSLATKAMTLASQRLGNLPYTRPSEWMTLPTVLATDQKFVGLHMVTVDSCFCALSAAGAYTVDWGDGTTQNIATGVTAYHQYDYATLTTTSTSDATITSFGYKQAIVTVTPQAGQQLTSLNLNVIHNQTGLQQYSSGFVDVAIASPYLIGCFIGATNTSGTQAITMSDLEIVNIVKSAVLNFSYCLYGCYSLQSVNAIDMSSCTTATSMFQNCYSLQTVPLFNLGACTTATSMFNGCYSLQAVPLFNLSACTITTSMFSACYSLQTVPLFNLAALITASSMFSNCTSLQTVPLFNLAALITATSMFNNCFSLQTVPLFNLAALITATSMFSTCYSLQKVPLFNLAALITATSMFSNCRSLQTVPLFNLGALVTATSMFSGCASLQTVPLFNLGACTTATSMFQNCYSLVKATCSGTKVSIAYSNCMLSATQLNAIYTALATVTAQTITVTGNWGAATDTPSIATAKGWTVTG